LGLAGAVTWTPVAVRVKLSVFARALWSNPCVTDPSRIQRTSVTWAAFGVVTEKVAP